MRRIGLIGFGFIGRSLYRAVEGGAHPGLQVAFVHNRSRNRLDEVRPDLILEDLAGTADRTPDLIVESAHPAVSIAFGARFLDHADYMPLSVTALADDGLRTTMLAAARASGHRLLVPKGALVGTDGLFSWRWQDVCITFRKHPRNLDLARSFWKDRDITRETVLYDGPVRGIADLYPRNVNTMVTCALATIGLDRDRARLIADPALEVAVAEVEAWGNDGSYISTTKRQPAVGVSGTEMVQSTLRSVLKASSAYQTMDFL